MKFTSEQIAELPTLKDVILNFADLTDDFEDNGGWLPMAFCPFATVSCCMRTWARHIANMTIS